jgi:hypothetical protein
MKNKFLASPTSETPPTPSPAEQPVVQAPSKKRFGKKLFIAFAAIAIIVVIVAAVLLIPPSNADEISLGVQYSAGEKLTYDITTSMTTHGENSSSNLVSQSTLTVNVVSFDGETYTLNYTSSTSDGDYSYSNSQLIDVKASEMITVLALLPIGIQFADVDTNNTNPFMTAVFDQSTAQVGDTWQIPLTTGEPGYSQTENLTVTFKAIQDLTVPAGTFKVFAIDFSTITQASSSSLSSVNIDFTGQSFLEYGTCKQIQSDLQVNMSEPVSLPGSSNFSVVNSFTSILKQDVTP